MTLKTWKLAGVIRDAEALRDDFGGWCARTGAGTPLEVHYSQVRRLTALLEGLVKSILKKLDAEDIRSLCEAEADILSVRRVWEYFRAKLFQRENPMLNARLSVADDMAWCLFKPLLDAARSARAATSDVQEPPLVYFNGGASPFAVARHRAFEPHDVDREWDSELFGDVLTNLPLPVVGLPWNQANRLPSMMCLAHELGHVVEEDFGLRDEVEAAILGEVGEERALAWRRWRREVFADFFGALTGGPAYVLVLASFLFDETARLEEEKPNPMSEYPTRHQRVQLCRAVLAAQGHSVARIQQAWPLELDGSYGNDSAWMSDSVKIAKALLKLTPTTLGAPLAELVGLKRAADNRVRQIAEDRVGKIIPDAPPKDVRELVSAATYAFDKDPVKYTAEVDARFVDQHPRVHPAGTRSPVVVSLAERTPLLQAERQNADNQYAADVEAGGKLLARYRERRRARQA